MTALDPQAQPAEPKRVDITSSFVGGRTWINDSPDLGKYSFTAGTTLRQNIEIPEQNDTLVLRATGLTSGQSITVAYVISFPDGLLINDYDGVGGGLTVQVEPGFPTNVISSWTFSGTTNELTLNIRSTAPPGSITYTCRIDDVHGRVAMVENDLTIVSALARSPDALIGATATSGTSAAMMPVDAFATVDLPGSAMQWALPAPGLSPTTPVATSIFSAARFDDDPTDELALIESAL